ncbi:uncharacterized protein VDAG_02190 [Verticillium dahliae VdLs.17]|uniref:NACHT domain-containing protein n=1 Tax=Verticillium dahliae (strain VdLs.17 / ATCC MYA-4575 / FGSC 10137) TaxID=498257 RepID=G2WV49_VERDV|nr:uncharacterized protein VDAG_02190 [Verticillium dahliae VdLs.17]EGY20174.1 hypothetical protein VDAG_02190 [Verticillium dahliae VdLs.17]KAH6690032.1 hypothetical protein EV126DRAFT_348089 [Verticillium dahliae]
MDPLSIAGTTAGLLTLTAQIITRGYACMMRLKSNDDDVRTAVNDVSSFSGILMAIESQCKERGDDIASPMSHLIIKNQPLWRKKVDECEAVLVEMLEILDSLTKANKAQLLIKGNSLWEKLQKSTTQTETSKSFFILCLQLQNNEDIRSSQKISGKIMSSLDRLRDEQDRARQEAKLKERKEQQHGMMEWLGFPGEAMQDDLINTGHPGSSQWLFEREEFIDWLTADGQSGLWLRGPQGAGKTIIVSRVIDFIQTQCLDQDAVLLFHFCRFTDEATRSQDQLLGALITQLLDNLPEDSPLPDTLTSMMKRSRFSSYPRVSRLKPVFLELCKAHAMVYIVVDGLDELDNFKDILELKSAFESYINVEILPEDVESDRKLDPGLLVMELATRAGGMFLWAVCQVQYLSRIRTTITPDLIATLPPALESIFENVLMTLEDKDRKMTLRILQLVMFSFRSLDLAEIDEAIAISPSSKSLAGLLRLRQKDAILEMCGCMLSQSPRTKKIQLAHSSVELFATCVRYLSMNDFDSDTFRETFRLALDGGHADSDLQAFAKAPFLDYAVSHLVSHMKKIELVIDSTDHDCTGLADRFFFEDSSRFTSWLLVRQYLDGTYRNPPGSNAYHIAAIYGIEQVFGLGPDQYGLKAQTLDGRNVLHLALENQQWEIVDAILRLGLGDLLSEFDKQGRSPLHVAVELGNSFMVQRLIEGGADPNLASSLNQGRTPIFMAVENKWDELTEYLSGRANLDICLDDGRSLHHVAAQSGSLEWITALER